jgi:hypothetical protein
LPKAILISGPALADIGGDFDGIHETGRGRRKADHFRIAASTISAFSAMVGGA